MIASGGEAIVNPSRPSFTVVRPAVVHHGLTRRANNAVMSKLFIVIIVAVIAVVAWVATRPAAPQPFAGDYQRALEAHPGSESAIDAGLERFAVVYGNLTHANIGNRVEELYADPVYFNDSLKTFHSRPPLVEYMKATGAMLENSTVEVDQVLRDGNDVFVRWTMEFTASAMGREIKSESVGMTHLRFDDQGRVVLHQDFWDSAAGLYRNLPVVGYALKQVDKRMGE